MIPVGLQRQQQHGLKRNLSNGRMIGANPDMTSSSRAPHRSGHSLRVLQSTEQCAVLNAVEGGR